MSDELQKVAFTDEDRKRLLSVVTSVASVGSALVAGPVGIVAGGFFNISAVMDRRGRKFALVPLDEASGLTRDHTTERHAELARLRRLGQMSTEQLTELEGLETEIRNSPPPPEYALAVESLSEDRKALRDSLNRMEDLLRK